MRICLPLLLVSAGLLLPSSPAEARQKSDAAPATQRSGVSASIAVGVRIIQPERIAAASVQKSARSGDRKATDRQYRRSDRTPLVEFF